MIHIAYYISAFDKSQAVRACTIIDAYSRVNPFVFFYIRTSAADWLFNLHLRNNYFYYEAKIDAIPLKAGGVKADSSSLLLEFEKFYEAWDEHLHHETQFLLENKIALVLGDIPPLAFAAARNVRVHSVGIGNFSPEELLQKYMAEIPGFMEYVKRMRHEYRHADLLLRLPFHSEMDAFRNIRDIPLVCRQARRRRNDIRRFLGCEPADRIVLLALDEKDQIRLNLDALKKFPHYKFVFPGTKSSDQKFIAFVEQSLPLEELINAADFVIALPEYRIIADCIANSSPLLFTIPEGTPVHAPLLDAAHNHCTSVFLNNEDFFQGNWREALLYLEDSPALDQNIRLDGAAVAARKIDDFLKSTTLHSSRRNVSAANPRKE